MKNNADQIDIVEVLKKAETAARIAGGYLLQKLGSAQVKHQKDLNDDLLDVDLEAEHIILTTLRTETPDIGILSEESEPQEKYGNYWIIDPLDGSANFQHGSPLFGIAIALVINQITVAGIVYLPGRDEMFTAIQSKGAFLNEKRIHVSSTTTLDKAIAHLGDFAKGNDQQAISESVNDILTLSTTTYRVRMIGTAATDLAYVACGRADLLVNHATTPWDIEAGKLILLEAGGHATNKHINNRTLSIYSNGLIHQEAEILLYSQTHS